MKKELFTRFIFSFTTTSHNLCLSSPKINLFHSFELSVYFIFNSQFSAIVSFLPEKFTTLSFARSGMERTHTITGKVNVSKSASGLTVSDLHTFSYSHIS